MKYFERLTQKPKNIAELKKFVLQLAVQGKLTEEWRNTNYKLGITESGADLLEKIKAEKQALIKAGKLKAQKPLPKIEENEIPFEVPDTWVWTRLGEISNYGESEKIEPKKLKDKNIWILELEDIEKTSSKLLQKLYLSERQSKSTKSVFKKGNVLYGKLRPYLDKVIVADEDGICTTEILPLQIIGNNNPYFIKLTLKRPDFLIYVDSQVSGMRMPRLKTESGRLAKIPIPPLAEQKAIVEKVESLFAKIDSLHTLAVQRQQLKQQTAETLLKKLNATNENLQADWQLLQQNFGKLITTKTAVKQLRQSILQLAVQGKLTEEWRITNYESGITESGADLLEKIKAQKQALIKAGKLKAQKPLPKIEENEIPFDVPDMWVWAKLGEIAQHNSGKTLHKSKNTGEPREYITTSNLYWGFFKLDNIKTMLIEEKELDKCQATTGDLLICEGGEAGRSAVWEENYPICFQNHVHRVRPYAKINSYYIFRYFQKIDLTGEINNYRTGMGISNMSGKNLSSIILPLPPLAEQKAIVEKVEKLLRWCDELEAKIENREQLNGLIMKYMVKEYV